MEKRGLEEELLRLRSETIQQQQGVRPATAALEGRCVSRLLPIVGLDDRITVALSGFQDTTFELGAAITSIGANGDLLILSLKYI